MLKVLVLSLIFVICTAMGLAKRQELVNRKQELGCIIRFAEYAKNEIVYRNMPLDKIINDKKTTEISAFFCDISCCNEPHILSKYERIKEKNKKATALNAEDIQCMDRLFSLLGTTCGNEQVKLIDNIINDLNGRYKIALSDCTAKGSLYTKMGIAAGFLAVVICI